MTNNENHTIINIDPSIKMKKSDFSNLEDYERYRIERKKFLKQNNNKKYYSKNKADLSERAKEYYHNLSYDVKQSVIERNKEIVLERLRTDPEYRERVKIIKQRWRNKVKQQRQTAKP